MKATIQIADRSEGDRIIRALGNPTVRAYLNVVGVLLTLPPNTAMRVLGYASDVFTHDAQIIAEANTPPRPHEADVPLPLTFDDQPVTSDATFARAMADA